DQLVVHLGIVFLDQRVAGRRIAVEIAVPTLDAGVDEALRQVGLFARQLARALQDRTVAGVAGISQQQYDRLYLLFFDRIGLARQIALLHGLLVGEEGCGAEVVGADLVVG